MTTLVIPVSFGEAADKMSILQIKSERVREPGKLTNIRRELALITETLKAEVKEAATFQELFSRLREINERLWDIEDRLREHEQRQDFGAEFVRLARAVYRTNDERSRAKQAIDELFDSPIREEKSYAGSNSGDSRP